MKFSKECVLILLLLLHHEVKSIMTEKQLQSLLKMTRNTCQAKTKVSTALIDGMHRGEFVKDRTLMCYMECCLKIGKMIKDGKFDYDSVMAQTKTIPLERQQPSIDSTNNCKNAGGLADKCESAFDIYKCIYDSNPPEFYLS